MRATDSIIHSGFLNIPSLGRWILLACFAAPCLAFGGTSRAGSPVPREIRSPEQRVSGVVQDPTGAVLPRTWVRILDEAGNTVATTETNSRGEFSVDLPRGSYTVDAVLAGFLPLRGVRLSVDGSAPPLALTLDIPSIEQQIIVTATNTETPLTHLGTTTTVLTRDRLEMEGVGTVAEALRRVPGLVLVQSGGDGQLSSLFVRGGESDYTKILIDGVTVNDPGGSFNFAALATGAIDRIEIIRGPQSALFGSDAIAGVIQIFTRRGISEGLSPAPGIAVEGGSFSTLRYAGGVQGSSEEADYALSFSRLDTDNEVVNGSFNHATLAANLGWSPSKKLGLRAIFRSETGRNGVPGSHAFRRPESDEYAHRRNISGTFAVSHFASRNWTQKLAYTVNDTRQLSVDPTDSGSFVAEFEGRRAPFPSFDFPFEFLNQNRRQKLNYQSEVLVPGGNLLTIGADYERESGIVGDPGFEPLSAVRNNYGLYFQDQWAFENRLFLTVGVRIEHNDNFGFFTAPRTSLAFHLHQPSPGGFWGLTKLKGNFGLGIKEPTLVESFSTSPFFRGNPDLRPERSNSFDVGIEQHFGPNGSWAEVTYFQNHFRDQIGFSVTDFQTFEGSFFNLGKSRARGIEASFRAAAGPRVELQGAYTFLDSEVLESGQAFDPVFQAGRPLLRRPRHSGFIELRFKPGRWTFAVTERMVGRRTDSDFSGLGMSHNPGYGILDLMVSYRLTSSISWFGIVRNALDRNYMEVLGFPALRAHFRFGIRAGI